MDPADVDHALRDALARADDDDEAGAWAALGPLEAAADTSAAAARGLALALAHGGLDRARRLAAAERLLDRWSVELGVLSPLGEATERLVDLRYLNAAPPEAPFFGRLVAALGGAFDEAPDDSTRVAAARGLTTAARVAGRRFDAVCEAAHRALLAARPNRWQEHYNFGLFLKNRGRFAEGLEANQAAAERGGADEDSVIWNLGICATGAGDGAAALEQWGRIGSEVALGPDGLPEGRFGHVQVRLAERPVAERSPEQDDPGAEETVWVERKSPCHGQIINALYQDLGVDYGDLVLFDGAAIVSRRWGEREVPVFPHLASLRPGGWSIFWFAATQAELGQVDALGPRLGAGVELYVHTENFRVLCRTCWERQDQDHAHTTEAHRVVTGKLVVPPDRPLAEVARALVAEEAAALQPRVYVPDLWTTVGDYARARVALGRYRMLADALHSDAP